MGGLSNITLCAYTHTYTQYMHQDTTCTVRYTGLISRLTQTTEILEIARQKYYMENGNVNEVWCVPIYYAHKKERQTGQEMTWGESSV